MLKHTLHNVMTWWFASDTPIRRHKLKLSPTLRWASEQVSQQFTPPSGAATVAAYKRIDKVAFAKAVDTLIKSTTKPLVKSLDQN